MGFTLNWPAVTTSSGPLQFVKDSVNTSVSQDTGTPSASVPLPIAILNTSGVPISPALESTQLANGVLVGAVNEAAAASDTASSGLNGRLQRIAQRLTTSIASLTSLIALLPSSIGRKASADSLSVTLSSDHAAVPASQSGTWNITNVSGTVSLPTGASTEAKQDTGNTSLSSINTKTPALGNAVMASSVPVTISSDQTGLKPMTDVTSSASLAALNQAATITCAGLSTVGIQFTGSWTATNTFEGTVDGSTWVSVFALPRGTTAVVSTTNATTNGLYAVPVAGLTQFRVRCSAFTAGPVVVTLAGNVNASLTQTFSQNALSNLVAATQSGVWSTRLLDGASNSVTIGQKTMANSLPFVIASDQTAVPISGTVTTSPVYLTCIDKARLDFSTSNVTTAAYVTLDASLAANCKEIEVYNSSIEPLLLATGAAASEVDQMYIMPGGNGRVPFVAASAVRTSLKAVSATANSGQILINFYG